MFYSQAGQDVWALQKTNKGFFVDIGAHDGVESSNTYALEKAGWTGICIEPNPVSFEKLRLFRRCTCLNRFVADDLAVILAEQYCPIIIDYISIDVDGTELGILKGMDFKGYHVKMITVEHNQYLEGPARQEQIFDYLTARGFIRKYKDVKCLDPNYYGAIYEDWYENRFTKPV